MKNQKCYNESGEFLGWYSRSMATAVFIFGRDSEGDWCVLASERGGDAADFQGMWNCPCGYLDFDETVKEGAARELKEEIGIDISPDALLFCGYNDKPTENRQNVTFRFYSIIKNRRLEDFKFSKEGNEGEEVGEIKWIKISDIDKYEWAFGHREIIMELYNGLLWNGSLSQIQLR